MAIIDHRDLMHVPSSPVMRCRALLTMSGALIFAITLVGCSRPNSGESAVPGQSHEATQKSEAAPHIGAANSDETLADMSNDKEASTITPDVESGHYTSFSIRGTPVVKNGDTSGQTWVQGVPLDATVQQFSMAIETIDDVPSGRLDVVVADELDLLRPITNEQYYIQGPLAKGSVVYTPTYVRRARSGISVGFLTNVAMTSRAPARVISIVAERTQEYNAPQGANPKFSALSDSPGVLKALGAGLARIKIGEDYCSGFAITQNLLVTNNHCIRDLLSKNQDPCISISILFDFLNEARLADAITARCDKVVATDTALDYAILKFSSESPVVPFPVGDSTKISDSVPMAVLQYPEGLSAQVSKCDGPPAAIKLESPTAEEITEARASCRMHSPAFFVVRPEQIKSSFGYSCDTVPGSSGSPVVVNGVAVGLHFSWDYRYYDAGGHLEDSYNAVTCLSTKLRLPNWGKSLCAVLDDARAKAPTERLPQC